MHGGRAYGPFEDARRRSDPRRQPVPLLWDRAISEWVVYLRGTGASANTVRARRDSLETLARRIGVANPWEVTTADLITLLGQLQWANATRNNRRTAFSLFYEWAKRVGLTDHNPVEEVPTARVGPAQPRPAPIDVYMRSYARANSLVRIVLRLAFELALRRSEIASVHRDDIVEMPHGPALWVHGKGAKDRLIPLPDDFAHELRVHCEARGGYLLPGQVDGHMSASHVGKLANAAIEDPWTLHTLRHACATGLLAGGVNLRVIQEILGHASVATTQIYTAVDSTQVRAAIEQRAHQAWMRRAS